MTENPCKVLFKERENAQNRLAVRLNQRWKEYCAINGIEPCGEIVWRPIDWEKEAENIAKHIASRNDNQRS